jgi:hypothetical protein
MRNDVSGFVDVNRSSVGVAWRNEKYQQSIVN